MNKKIIMFTTIAILSILCASMIAMSQAGHKPKSEFVGYDYRAVMGPNTIISVDSSGAPIIKMEMVQENIIEITLTIDNQVYTYPDDFDLIASSYAEINAVTGEGFARTEGTLVFNIAGSPTLSYWVVSSLSGYNFSPQGTILNPENIKIEGELKLTGTKKLNTVDGFGLTEGRTLPPDFTNQQIHQFGFIKDWTL